LPVQLLLQQHKMLLNKQQDQQLKENHKLYLKKARIAFDAQYFYSYVSSKTSYCAVCA